MIGHAVLNDPASIKPNKAAHRTANYFISCFTHDRSFLAAHGLDRSRESFAGKDNVPHTGCELPIHRPRSNVYRFDDPLTLQLLHHGACGIFFYPSVKACVRHAGTARWLIGKAQHDLRLADRVHSLALKFFECRGHLLYFRQSHFCESSIYCVGTLRRSSPYRCFRLMLSGLKFSFAHFPQHGFRLISPRKTRRTNVSIGFNPQSVQVTLIYVVIFLYRSGLVVIPSNKQRLATAISCSVSNQGCFICAAASA